MNCSIRGLKVVIVFTCIEIIAINSATYSNSKICINLQYSFTILIFLLCKLMQRSITHYNWFHCSVLNELNFSRKVISKNLFMGFPFVLFLNCNYYNWYFRGRGTRTQPLIFVGCFVHYWVSCANYKGGFVEIAFSSSTGCTQPLRSKYAIIIFIYTAITLPPSTATCMPKKYIECTLLSSDYS